MGLCGGAPPVQENADPNQVGVERALFVEYKSKVLPVEERHIYNQFYTPSLRLSEFQAKPSVLVLGQYSVGKTTMIEYLLGRPYPGSRTGPEPTTDTFTMISYGETERALMGNALVTKEDFPLQALEKFGDKFLSKLRGVTTSSNVLKHINLIDTPGILSGEKQHLSRGYDFDSVVRFLAEKVDIILMLFDTSKLDISDEFKKVIQNMGGNEEKVKIVLNKADSVKPGELIHVRGALMWNLSKIMRCAEIPKVYIGSFWAAKLKEAALKETFRSDYTEILTSMCDLPNVVQIRKINDVAKRAKAVRIHAWLMDSLLQKRFGKPKTREAMLKTTKKLKILRCFVTLQDRLRVNEFDLPDIADFQARASESDGTRWNKLNKKLMAQLEIFLAQDVAKMLRHLPTKAKNKLVDPSQLQASVMRFVDEEEEELKIKSVKSDKPPKEEEKKSPARDDEKKAAAKKESPPPKSPAKDESASAPAAAVEEPKPLAPSIDKDDSDKKKDEPHSGDSDKVKPREQPPSSDDRKNVRPESDSERGKGSRRDNNKGSRRETAGSRGNKGSRREPAGSRGNKGSRREPAGSRGNKGSRREPAGSRGNKGSRREPPPAKSRGGDKGSRRDDDRRRSSDKGSRRDSVRERAEEQSRRRRDGGGSERETGSRRDKKPTDDRRRSSSNDKGSRRESADTGSRRSRMNAEPPPRPSSSSGRRRGDDPPSRKAAQDSNSSSRPGRVQRHG